MPAVPKPSLAGRSFPSPAADADNNPFLDDDNDQSVEKAVRTPRKK